MAAEKQNRFLGALIRMRSLNAFLVFALLYAVFAVFSPGHRFTSSESIGVFLATSSEFNIVALVVGLLMIAGEFDLSVGSILVFTSYVFLTLFKAGLPVLPALLATMGAGGAVGVFNGVITVKARIPSFITTLGGMLMWRGVTLFWSGGLQEGLELPETAFMYRVVAGRVGNLVPAQFLWFVGIAVVIALVVHLHRFGNWVFNTGDNKQAARAMGVDTDAVKIACFVIVGSMVAFAGVMQMFRSGTFSARAGDGWELKAIAASVVGGTALSGGIGSILGVFWGALIISVIENGLIFMRVNYWWTFTIFGVIIISTSLISRYIDRRRAMLGSERC
jgi:simple sugar transport system permease protein